MLPYFDDSVNIDKSSACKFHSKSPQKNMFSDKESCFLVICLLSMLLLSNLFFVKMNEVA